MDRTRGLFVLANKKANRMGWLLCKVNLGGLGRNRTTDTRIFKTCVVDIPNTSGTATGSCCDAIFVVDRIHNARNKRAGTEPILTLHNSHRFMHVSTAQPRHTEGTEACSKAAMTIGSIAGC
jgi:hypothetical protein